MSTTVVNTELAPTTASIEVSEYGVFVEIASIEVSEYGVFVETASAVISEYGVFVEVTSIVISEYGVFVEVTSIVISEYGVFVEATSFSLAKVFVVCPCGFQGLLDEIGRYYTVGCVLRPVRVETYYACVTFI